MAVKIEFTEKKRRPCQQKILAIISYRSNYNSIPIFFCHAIFIFHTFNPIDESFIFFQSLDIMYPQVDK